MPPFLIPEAPYGFKSFEVDKSAFKSQRLNRSVASLGGNELADNWKENFGMVIPENKYGVATYTSAASLK